MLHICIVCVYVCVSVFVQITNIFNLEVIYNFLIYEYYMLLLETTWAASCPFLSEYVSEVQLC
jgi:hypothetical protein